MTEIRNGSVLSLPSNAFPRPGALLWDDRGTGRSAAG